MYFVNKKSLRFFSIICLSIILSAFGGGKSRDTSGQDIPIVLYTPAPLAKLASRVQGVAPLAVFFDALNVTDVAQPPEVNGRREYADFSYTWDFNDSVSADTWATSGKSKNEADGYNAAHVFETPGTYTVKLSVKDGVSVDETHQVTITVDDPDVTYATTNTICVSTAGDFTGCPVNATQLTTSTFSDIQAYIVANRRVLFKRGESWTTSSSIALGNVGPLTIGAYGACTTPDARGICSNAPIINDTGGAGNGLFLTNNQADVRIMDLNLVDGGTRASAIDGLTGLNRQLFLRLKTSGYTAPFHFSHWDTKGHDQLALVDNDAINGRSYIVYGGSERLMVLGNRLRDTNTSHVLRIWQAYKGVIAHNELSGSSANSDTGRHALKLHGPHESEIQDTGPAGLDRRTQYVVLADNLIGGSGPWSVAIGPQDDSKNEFIQDVIVENNDFYPGWGTQSCCSSSVQTALSVWASYVTVRNNIMSGEGSSKYYTGITIQRRGVEPIHAGNRVHNNTIYKSEAGVSGSNYAGISIATGILNTSIKNNLVHLNSTADTVKMISDAGTGTVKSNNLLTPLPDLVDAENVDFLLKNFRPKSATDSPAVNAGTNVPVFKDKDGSNRTQGVAIDLGAFELQ